MPHEVRPLRGSNQRASRGIPREISRVAFNFCETWHVEHSDDIAVEPRRPSDDVIVETCRRAEWLALGLIPTRLKCIGFVYVVEEHFSGRALRIARRSLDRNQHGSTPFDLRPKQSAKQEEAVEAPGLSAHSRARW